MFIELWHKNGEYPVEVYKSNHVPMVGDYISVLPSKYIVEKCVWIIRNNKQKTAILFVKEVKNWLES